MKKSKSIFLLCLLVSFSVFSQERIRDVRTNPDIYFLKIDDVPKSLELLRLHHNQGVLFF